MAGQGVEGQQVVLPLPAPVHGSEQPEQVGGLIDMPDELAASLVPCPKAQPLQLRQKVSAGPVAFLGGLHHGGIEVSLGLSPQQSQLVPGKAVHRRAQGGNKGHILVGIVHDLQDGQGYAHLSGGKKVLSAVRSPGNPLLTEGPQVMAQDRARAPEQNHDVRGADGAEPIPLGDEQRLFQQLPDAPGGKACLHQVLALPFTLLFPQKGQVQPVYLQGVVLPLRERGSGDQGLVVGVVQLAEFRGHNVPEQVVAPQKHLGPGAEIPGEHPLSGLSLLCLVPDGKASVLVQEDGGIGQTEAVNGLLHVAHLKKLTAALGDGGEDGVLHLVGILVLVHQHLVKPD